MPEEISGVDKAATLLFLLGPQASAQILQSMDTDQIVAVTEAMSRLKEIPKETKEQVLAEFSDLFDRAKGATFAKPGYVEEILQKAVGGNKAKEIFNAVYRSASFEFLKSAPMKSLSKILQGEHPQTVAVVLSQLSPEQAAQLLELLPESMRLEAVKRSVETKEYSHEAMEHIGRVLDAHLKSEKEAGPSAGSRLADIISMASRGLGDALLEGFKKETPELSEDIMKYMFLFDGLADLTDISIQKVLRKVDQRSLACALKGASQKICEKVYKNMTEDASKALIEDIDSLGSLPVKEIESAQQKVIKIVKELRQAGELPELSHSK